MAARKAIIHGSETDTLSGVVAQVREPKRSSKITGPSLDQVGR
jgi:hypothetical protein